MTECHLYISHIYSALEKDGSSGMWSDKMKNNRESWDRGNLKKTG